MTTTNDLSRYSSNELAQELNRRNTKMGGVDARPVSIPASANDNSPVRAVEHLIYGKDDRKDICEITDQAILDDADSVVAILQVLPLNKITRSPDGTEVIIDDEDGAISGKPGSEIRLPKEALIVDLGDGTHTLFLDFGTAKNLCDTEPFRDQPVCALGASSGFLVAPDIIATAAHCVFHIDAQGRIKKQKDLKRLRFIFGLRVQDRNNVQSIENLEVYEANCVINYGFDESNGKDIDWALIRLKQPVIGHNNVSIRQSGKVADEQLIHVIGHPAGLPLKYTASARVQKGKNAASTFFVCNSDTYAGNSGSPVFNSHTNTVEGILVSRPESKELKDFVSTPDGCQISNRLSNQYGFENCTRTTEFIEVLKTSVWSEFKPVAGLCGEKNQGADVAVVDLNGNGKPDLIVFHIQNPDGENKGFYQIGRDLDDSGNVTGWSEFIQVPGRFGVDTEEAGIAITDLSKNGRPDLVVFHIEKNAAGNRGFYRIGYDLDAKGNVTKGWTQQPIEIKARFGTSSQGAGIAITDLNGNGKPDLIVFFVDNPKAENPKSENKGYYFIGRDLDTTGKVTGGWSEFLGVPGLFGAETQGAGVAVANINKRRCLIVFHLDHPTQGEKGNQGYYRIGWDLDAKGNVSGWSDAKALPWRFGHESQGAGIATICFNGNTNPCFNGNMHPHMIVYHIDNPAGANKGYYRTGWILP